MRREDNIGITGDEAKQLLARMLCSEKRGYSVKEAAHYTGIAEGTLRNWISDGLLPASHVGEGRGKVILLKENLDRLLEARRQGNLDMFEKLMLGKGG